MSNKATCDKCGAIGKPSMNWTSMTTNICVDCQRENVKDVPFYTTEQIDPLLARIAFLEAQIDKMKCCENCGHNKGGECLAPDLSELTHQEYCNGCEHWRPRDAA